MRAFTFLSVACAVAFVSGCATSNEPGTAGEATATESAALKGSPGVKNETDHASLSLKSAAKADSQTISMQPVTLNALSASTCWDLAQGPKNNDLGDVCIANDGDTIYVTYTTDGACLLTQVHVCAATADFPWSPPGQCGYNAELDAPATSYTVAVPLSDFPDAVCGETVFHIQAHAALDCTASGGGQESAYAGTFKGNVEYTLQCFQEEGGCTLTQGYWKNHEEDWSEVDVTLGSVTYSPAQALALFQTPVSGDASLILAHQLIAARLNVQVGGTGIGAIADALLAADAWLTANADADGALPDGVAADSAAGAEAVSIAATLDDFNNGLIGPGHCD